MLTTKHTLKTFILFGFGSVHNIQAVRMCSGRDRFTSVKERVRRERRGVMRTVPRELLLSPKTKGSMYFGIPQPGPMCGTDGMLSQLFLRMATWRACDTATIHSKQIKKIGFPILDFTIGKGIPSSARGELRLSLGTRRCPHRGECSPFIQFV